MRIGTWVHGDLGGKRDSSVKVERPFFAAFQRSPIIDEIRQPVYPASLAARRTPARERDAHEGCRVKLNLQFPAFLHVADAADTDVNLMNTFPAGMVRYHARSSASQPLTGGHLKLVGGALWAQ